MTMSQNLFDSYYPADWTHSLQSSQHSFIVPLHDHANLRAESVRTLFAPSAGAMYVYQPSKRRRVLNRAVDKLERDALPGYEYVIAHLYDKYRRNLTISTISQTGLTRYVFLSFLVNERKAVIEKISRKDIAPMLSMNWNDGHPGKAKNAAACFDGWGDMFEQKPSVTSVGVDHALGVDLNYKAYMAGNPIEMGGPGKPEENAVKGGPYVPEEFKQNGLPQGEHSKEGGAPPGMAGTLVGGSSTGMSIHKSEGLVPINDKCESTIPGLYASGDALGSSLAGSAVQGAIAAKAAAEFCQGVEMPKILKAKVKEI